jgi:hypothetical protein
MKHQEFPLTQSHGGIFGAATPAHFLETFLCVAQVLEADSNVDILGLSKPNVSINLERKEGPFQGHRRNSSLVKAFENGDEYLKVP